MSNDDDKIYRPTFELDNSITLAPGEYFFSHDGTITPEPTSLAVWSLLALVGVTIAGWRRR